MGYRCDEEDRTGSSHVGTCFPKGHGSVVGNHVDDLQFLGVTLRKDISHSTDCL